MSNYIETTLPKFQMGVHDPFLRIKYWVSSETEISFDDARLIVSRFLANRARQLDLDYKKVYSLPTLLHLIVDKDNRILSPQLQTPEEIKDQENFLEKNKERLLTDLQTLE